MALQATGIAGVKALVPFFVAGELVARSAGVAYIVVALLMAPATRLLVMATTNLEPGRVVAAFPGVQGVTRLAVRPRRQVHAHRRADEISLVAVIAGAWHSGALVVKVVGVAVNALDRRVGAPEREGRERVVETRGRPRMAVVAPVALVAQGPLVPVRVAVDAGWPRGTEVIETMALAAVQLGVSPVQRKARAVVREGHPVPTAGGVAVRAGTLQVAMGRTRPASDRPGAGGHQQQEQQQARRPTGRQHRHRG